MKRTAASAGLSGDTVQAATPSTKKHKVGEEANATQPRHPEPNVAEDGVDARMERLKGKMLAKTVVQQILHKHLDTLRTDFVELRKEWRKCCDQKGHNFIRDTETGMYGESYHLCSVCGKDKHRDRYHDVV